MKKNNKGYSYRPNQRRKRIRINKIRFTIFVLSCLTILFGIGFGIKALLTDKVEVNIGLTDDLNPVEGESMYKLSLTWESLAADKYKDIQITSESNLKEKKCEDGIMLFGTKTCPNCKLAEKLLDKAKVNYKFVDAEEKPELAKKYSVKQAPTLVIVNKGKYQKAKNYFQEVKEYK